MKFNKLLLSTMFVMVVLFGTGQVDASLPVTSGLQFWLDATNVNSITAADGQLDNGDKISGLNDIIIGDNIIADNAIQSDLNAQPCWIESVIGINNKSAVRFNGANTYLNLSTLTIGENPTVFVVSQSAVQSSNDYSWHRSILAADNDPWLIDGNGYGFSYSRQPYNVFAVAIADGFAVDQVEGTITQDGNFNTIIFRRDSDSEDGSELYKRSLGDVNNVLMGTNKLWRTSGFHTGYQIGGGGDPNSIGRFYLGDIAEIIIYNRRLSDMEVNQVSDYLGKYIEPEVCGHPGTEYNDSDLNKDCYVNLADIAIFVDSWLSCTTTSNPDCDKYWKPGELAKQHWNAWRKSWDTFPIAAWSYWDRYDGTLAEYQTYEGADLTMVQAPLDQCDDAVDAGLRVITGSWETIYANEVKLNYYMNFPTPTDSNVVGYLLSDEPSDSLFEVLGQASEYIYDYGQRQAIPMITLFPSWSKATKSEYHDQITTTFEQTYATVLIVNDYPPLLNGTDIERFYETIEVVRDVSLNAEIGFMGQILATKHLGYRQPSESDLNWQVYSFISYGAQGIWYYNYRIGDEGYGPALVDHSDGNPTSIYYLAQEINGELKAMGSVLMSLKSTGVYHADSSVPSGTTQYVNGYVSFLSDFTGDEFILGEFENQDDAADTANYLMIMNKRHSATTTSAEEAANAIFTPNGTFNVHQFDTTTQTWQLLTGGAPYTINIGGGKGVLLRFSPI